MGPFGAKTLCSDLLRELHPFVRRHAREETSTIRGKAPPAVFAINSTQRPDFACAGLLTGIPQALQVLQMVLMHQHVASSLLL